MSLQEAWAIDTLLQQDRENRGSGAGVGGVWVFFVLRQRGVYTHKGKDGQ